MRNFARIIGLLAFSSLPLSAHSKTAIYKVPMPTEHAELLPIPLNLTQDAAERRSEKTDFGVKLYNPPVSVIKREEEASKGQVLLQKEGRLNVELENPRSPWLYFSLGGQQVFYHIKNNFSEAVKFRNSNELDLPVSSVQFDQEDGDWAWIEYRFYMALEEIPPIVQTYIREDYRSGLDGYLKEYGRKDKAYSLNEAPQKGLAEDRFKKKQGYVFSICIRFQEGSTVSTPRKEGDCYVYSLSQRGQILGMIPGESLNINRSGSELYLIERTRKLRNESKVQAHWAKIKLADQKFVSLGETNWQTLDR